jgi:hypothetical protein
MRQAMLQVATASRYNMLSPNKLAYQHKSEVDMSRGLLGPT